MDMKSSPNPVPDHNRIILDAIDQVRWDYERKLKEKEEELKRKGEELKRKDEEILRCAEFILTVPNPSALPKVGKKKIGLQVRPEPPKTVLSDSLLLDMLTKKNDWLSSGNYYRMGVDDEKYVDFISSFIYIE